MAVDMYGITGAARMRCEFTASTMGSKCVRCGKALRRDYTTIPFVVCGTPQFTPAVEWGAASAAVEKPGLGDAVESLLSSIGVTQERYSQVKQLFGLPSTCGCTDRKKALNEWGEKVASWWRQQPGGPAR